jgi:hypothetical protein
MTTIDRGRHEYRMSGWQKGGSILLGLSLTAFGIFLSGVLAVPSRQGASALAGILPLAIGIYMLALVVRSRLTIDGPRIEVRSVFGEKSADLREVEGFRTITTRNGSYWQLELKEGQGSITIQKMFDCDELRAWFRQLPDLDEQDRKELLNEIEQNQELGATTEERLARLAGAKRVSIGLSVLAIAAALGFALSSAAWHLTTAVVLAFVPVVLIYLVQREPLLYAIFKPKRDPRNDLTIAFFVCGFGLMFGSIDAHFVETTTILGYAVLVGLLCCAGVYAAARKNSQLWGAMIGMLLIAGAYGWGLAEAADTVLDRSTPANYTTTVENKRESHGRSTTYYFDLAPWGPIQGPNDVTVSYSTYRGAAIGDQVCLELRPGALHVQWYQVVGCAAQAGQ